MRLIKISYAIADSKHKSFRNQLSEVAILKTREDAGLERYLMPGAQIRVDVPKIENKGETLVEIICSSNTFNAEVTNLPLSIPRYLKRILKSNRVGKGYRDYKPYEGYILPAQA